MTEHDPLAPYRDSPEPPPEPSEVERRARLRLFEIGADVLRALAILLWIWIVLSVLMILGGLGEFFG